MSSRARGLVDLAKKYGHDVSDSDRPNGWAVRRG